MYHQKPLKLDFAEHQSPSFTRTDDLNVTNSMYLTQSQHHIRANSIQEPTLRGRFVAGNAFFNYDALGSLREGLAAVELLSGSYLGLAVNAVVAGFATIFVQYVFQQLLVADFAAHHEGQINAAKYLLQWPGAFAVFMGLISDCAPINGSRRKPYIIIGWILSCFMFAAVVIVHYSTESDATIRAYLLLIFSMLAVFGIQLAYIVSLAMLVELAQREHLYQRGQLQGLYMVLYFGASTGAHIMSSFLVAPTDDGMGMTTELDMSEAAVILAGASLFPVPFLLFFLRDERVDMHRVTISRRVSELWQLLQWKVVYKILFFLCGTVFFSAAFDPNVVQAIMLWSNVTPSKSVWWYTVRTGGKFVGVLMWKFFLINYSWRRLAFVGLLASVIANTILAVPTIYDGVRDEWYMYICSAVADVPLGWLEMFVLVAPTEIADVGREGAVIGLVNSYLVLITIATYTLWESVSDLAGMDVNIEDIMMDSRSTRNKVMVTGAIYIALNLIGVGAAVFIPTQKLDAQQLRAFGGYNRMARLVLVAAFVVLLGYDLVANIVKVAKNNDASVVG
ncbi:hypothetical protein Poli38472_009320 [Pythium oligandrum]|uniref:Uncharacterized protein n=1 Tax=Pythium oligandrum TaxID=41045 RepID=A0A8K1CMQ9_PYTOL|nr:hypothetical protein Poli38472_009320 [Pythium oligandrum]|eukprot:TMW65153.1 hypothetical protein Poli38472_009320 [Pythium oligandrum]